MTTSIRHTCLICILLFAGVVNAGDYGIDVQGVLGGLPDNPQILFQIKNTGSKEITFYAYELPWVDSDSLLVSAVRADKIQLKRSLLFDDGDREVLSLKPGKSLNGTVLVSLYYPEIKTILKETEVVLFWTYQMVLEDGTKLKRTSGWFSLPQLQQAPHSVPNSK
jgi:hypothetical protein